MKATHLRFRPHRRLLRVCHRGVHIVDHSLGLLHVGREIGVLLGKDGLQTGHNGTTLAVREKSLNFITKFL